MTELTAEPAAAERAAAERGRLMPMLFGAMHAQVLHTLTRLGVADRLADGPATARQLASGTGTQPAALYRLLRAGAALGLFALDGERFELTEGGRLLCADAPGSIRNLVLLFGGDAVWRSWGRLEYSVRTGQTAFEQVTGLPTFEYLAAHPDEEAVFNAAMAEHTREVAPAIAARCPLDGRGRVADLGGGNGALLAGLLTANPGVRGVLHDTASGLRDAERVLTEAGVRDRCEIVTGDFFDSVPEGCDAYVLKSVIHDWDDEAATRILRRCREAMAPGAVLYVAEPVVPDDPTRLADAAGTLMSDLNMLVCAGGRERTEGEFRSLLARAGLRLDGVARCDPPVNYWVLAAGGAGT
ncbi:methyltransferase [Pseudonocardia acaciae]|uniref:methyltransferase n=1 Tax=Pseudonocardia acaciae TaxID=551276 RepID=UPI000685DC1B|nr:methyltransferase [Pseudonocardia acaciae]